MARFLWVWLASVLSLALVIGGLNVVVDPFAILDMPLRAGINAHKVAAVNWPRLAKPYLVEAVDPRAIVVGSSTVDVGFDPDSAAWPVGNRPAFNLGIDGGRPELQLDFLRHAFVRTHPKLVIIGVTFDETFLIPPAGPASHRLSAAETSYYSYQDRLRVSADGADNPDYWRGRLQDLAFSVFSFDAVQNSVLTMIGQGRSGEARMTRSGFNTGGLLARWAREDGWHALVMDKNREKSAQFIRWSWRHEVSVAPVAEMVRLAIAKGARPIVVVLPGYVDKLEMLRQVGATPWMLAWKADIVARVVAAAGDGVPIWDFSLYSPYVTEPLPTAVDRATPMRWIWETIHFRPELGDLMLARMLADAGPPDLGVRLTPGTIAAQNEAFVAAQGAWVAAHPEDVARIAGVLGDAAQRVCHTELAACLAVPRRK